MEKALDMFNVKTLAAVSAVALLPMAGSAATVTIDSFLTSQEVIDPSGFGLPATSTVAAAEAIGGDRTITAAGDGASNPTRATSILVDGGSAFVANGPTVTGTALFEWAAGGFDLTDGGTNDTFVLALNSIDLSVDYALTIDGASAASSFNSATGNVEFDFSSFGDLSSADAISLLVSGPTSFDASFSFFGAEDLVENPVATIPVPAAGFLLGSVLLGAGFMGRRKS